MRLDEVVKVPVIFNYLITVSCDQLFKELRVGMAFHRGAFCYIRFEVCFSMAGTS